MGRPKKKPEYDPADALKEQIMEIALYYGKPYDDRKPVEKNHVTVRDVAAHFDISILKVRKALITASAYTTEISRKVQGVVADGHTIPEIMEVTKLSRASVYSYLPYSKIVYNLSDASVDADRKRLQPDRERMCRKFVSGISFDSEQEAEKELWDLLTKLEGCIFHTAKGLRFRYKIKGGEMFVDRQKDSITKAMVFMAFQKAKELDFVVSGPKKLGVFGASYIYPIFVRIGALQKI